MDEEEDADRGQNEQNDPDGESPDDVGEHGEIV